MSRRVVLVSSLDLIADASGDADAWAEARTLLLEIERRRVDLAPILADIDLLPDTAVGRACARRWRANCDRRLREIGELDRALDRLRRDAPGTVRLAEGHAAEGRIWIQAPGGRTKDED